MIPWDGNERRIVNNLDHDVLLEIKGDVKYILQWNIDHKTDDNKKHADNIERFKSIEKSMIFLQRVVWGTVGAGTLVAFCIQVLFKR